MKRALKTKQPKKGLKWRFSSCWFSLICTLPYIFLSFIQTILPSYMLCESTRKQFELANMVLTKCQNIDSFRLFKLGGRVRKRFVKFCHAPQVAIFLCFWSKIACIA